MRFCSQIRGRSEGDSSALAVGSLLFPRQEWISVMERIGEKDQKWH